MQEADLSSQSLGFRFLQITAAGPLIKGREGGGPAMAAMAVQAGGRVQEGDLVVVYETRDRSRAVRVCSQERLHLRWGIFKHSDWIGVPFGTKVYAQQGGGFVYLLAPTPELWTQVLSHRTQILYLPDISLIIAWLELRPGSVVLESGTGSGSLTTSLARAIAPTGHVHTFEFHQSRADTAREEFEKNGLREVVTVTLRDIQGEGFPPDLAGRADALFLDLPGPWAAVPSAARSLRADGPFCSFSPCIEQVQKTCEALRANGFADIRTMEILVRQFDVRQEQFLTNLGEESVDVGKPPPPKRHCENDEGRDGKRGRLGEEQHIRRPREGNNGALVVDGKQGQVEGEVEGHRSVPTGAGLEGSKREGGDDRALGGGGHGNSVEVGSLEGERLDEESDRSEPKNESKAAKGSEGNIGSGSIQTGKAEPNPEEAASTGKREGMKERFRRTERSGEAQVVARPAAQTKGHTGYLTFARNSA